MVQGLVDAVAYTLLFRRRLALLLGAEVVHAVTEAVNRQVADEAVELTLLQVLVPCLVLIFKTPHVLKSRLGH